MLHSHLLHPLYPHLQLPNPMPNPPPHLLRQLAILALHRRPIRLQHLLQFLARSVPVQVGEAFVQQQAAAFHHIQAGQRRALLRRTRGPQRTLDLYGLWRIDGAMRWRLAATNALHPRRTADQVYDDAGATYRRGGSDSTRAELRLALEASL